MVLSKFSIFTVVRLISVTSPSAPYLGIVIQSPSLTMSFVLIWMLATKPRMESLKTSSSTAEAAPIAVRKVSAERPVSREKSRIAAIR